MNKFVHCLFVLIVKLIFGSSAEFVSEIKLFTNGKDTVSNIETERDFILIVAYLRDVKTWKLIEVHSLDVREYFSKVSLDVVLRKRQNRNDPVVEMNGNDEIICCPWENIEKVIEKHMGSPYVPEEERNKNDVYEFVKEVLKACASVRKDMGLEYLINKRNKVKRETVQSDNGNCERCVCNYNCPCPLKRETTSIVSDKITDWGDWGESQSCDVGYFAVGIKIKYEQAQSKGDNTGINAIKLICTDNKEISSSEGAWGEWSVEQFCESRSRITGFSLRVQKSSGSNDDSATNGIIVICERGSNIELGASKSKYDNMVLQGTWTSEKSCPDQTYVCGIKTQVESPIGDGDDTSLNNVELICCNI